MTITSHCPKCSSTNLIYGGGRGAACRACEWMGDVEDVIERPVRMRVAVTFDVLIHDPEWTQQTIIENAPDYFTSALTDAEEHEAEQYPGRQPPYTLDVADLTVYPEPMYVEQLAAIGDDGPALRELNTLPGNQRRELWFAACRP